MREKIIELLYAENVRSDCGIERLADEICAIDPVKWVPVSERLPEEDTYVLISYRYKEGEGDTSHVYIDMTSYGDMYFCGRKVVKAAKHWRSPFEYFDLHYEVIAWMPLPEPYKEVE